MSTSKSHHVLRRATWAVVDVFFVFLVAGFLTLVATGSPWLFLVGGLAGGAGIALIMVGSRD